MQIAEAGAAVVLQGVAASLISLVDRQRHYDEDWLPCTAVVDLNMTGVKCPMGHGACQRSGQAVGQSITTVTENALDYRTQCQLTIGNVSESRCQA